MVRTNGIWNQGCRSASRRCVDGKLVGRAWIIEGKMKMKLSV